MPPTNSGTQDPYKPVDPNGLQTTSTGAAALAFVALVGSESETIASALGVGSGAPAILTAGLSLVKMGRPSLFTVGLVLLGLAILLNIASLVIRHQRSAEYDRFMAAEAEADKARRGSSPDAGPGTPSQRF